MRRYLLLWLALLLAACSGRNENEGVVTTDAASPLQLAISTSELVPGPSRLVLTVWDGPQRLADAQALEVTVFALRDNGEAADKVWEGAATGYRMDDVQYWVAYPDFPAAGQFGVLAFVTTADGQRVENRTVVQVKAEATAPAIGQPAPRSDTLTLADAPIEDLTSAEPYIERFYQLTVAEAAESGKPSIIAFVTPGHCTSALCAPVMGTLDAVSSEVGDAVNVVHVEVFRDFERQVVDPAFDEWQLRTEPWIFVLNADGTVAARLEGPVSPDELREVVGEVLGG